MSPRPCACHCPYPVVTSLIHDTGTCSAIAPVMPPASPMGDTTHMVAAPAEGAQVSMSVVTTVSIELVVIAERKPSASLLSRKGPSSRLVPSAGVL